VESAERRFDPIGFPHWFPDRIASERDCYRVMLVSSAERREARAFYRSLGCEAEAYRAFKSYLTGRVECSPFSGRQRGWKD